MASNVTVVACGGGLGETWKLQREACQFNEYLLLLDSAENTVATNACKHTSQSNKSPAMADASSYFVLRKLVLELLHPKLEELGELCASWFKRASEGGSQISFDRFRSLLSACVIGIMLLPQFGDLNSTPSSSIGSLLLDLAEKGLVAAMDSVEPAAFVNLTLREMRLCIPDIDTASFSQLQGDNAALLELLARLSNLIEQRQSSQSSENQTDLMDLDEDFDSQNSRSTLVSNLPPLARQNVQLSLSSRAFYTETKLRLSFLRLLHEDSIHLGLIPEIFIQGLLSLPDDDVLSCQRLLIEIARSDMVLSPECALNIIVRLGEIVGKPEYQSSEVAQTTCIEVISGLSHLWLEENISLEERVGDLYDYFIRTCLPSNVLSPKTQMSLSRLLFTLLKTNPNYGANLGLDSCRTSLLSILDKGSMKVKCFIAEWIADIFDLFILMLHDEIFVDVLDSLPTDPNNTAGLAFRLLVLSKMAQRWPTLLRRCTYHIFETPGKLPQSSEYARRCLTDISKTLNLGSPKELFQLFSRQLLYTWLEADQVGDIPFTIFGFSNLRDLIVMSQSEAVGLAMMRGQDEAIEELARIIGITKKKLIQANFTTTLAYSMIYAPASGGASKTNGEDRIKKIMGDKPFIEAVYVDLVDIVGLFFDLIDQEDSLERVFSKQADLRYASKNLDAIRRIAHSTAKLPPNQQPMFRAKYVFHELFRLCQYTEFHFRDLWTPAMVLAIARNLFNTVHPALGPLHACSVLRKVRIIICLAGSVALDSYCLEMLLNSIRSFIVDPECADDALGVSEYLLSQGSAYLEQVPSFMAGYALSTLASLRVFLESSQSSTTQEDQFKATMSKAQKFHEWFGKYLANYTSVKFLSKAQGTAFRSITQSAGQIRSSGNAERGTFESKLLLEILRDGTEDSQLLNESSRQLALGLLCGDFSMPGQVRNDVIESDDDAVLYGSAVWKSCETQNLSSTYLSWAGRVIGRSFSASGSIPEGILRESRLAEFIAEDLGSEIGLLRLVRELTAYPSSITAGLAEATLRTAISRAVLEDDMPLVTACQQSLSEQLFVASQWGSYHSPPSETNIDGITEVDQSVWRADIASQNWLTDLSAHLAQSVPGSILLSVLSPILIKVKGFAEKSFPFIIHLVLLFQLDQQQTMKRSISNAMKIWLSSSDPTARANQKLLIDSILYLRTQEYPKENSIADRLHWLDLDYTLAASAASSCGMFKTALLFTELVSSETGRSSKRSSISRETNINDSLLRIFENIDDPDAYYGLPEDASLSKVLARVEYEQEGVKSLAFRGAQYDSNIRLRRPASTTDGPALINALNTLGFAGLSHSLLQTQQNANATSQSLESTFSTARKLEMWNLPAPVSSDHHAVTTYKAYQSMHQATSLPFVQSTIYEGFSRTMQNLVVHGHNATTLRSRLGALASLSELDELLGASDPSELENIISRFQDRGQWMRSGM